MDLGFWDVVSWIVFGLVAGAIARLLVPGRQSIGWIMTILLGIAGSFVGGFLFSLLPFGSEPGFHATNLIGSVIGAVVLLLIYLFATKKS